MFWGVTFTSVSPEDIAFPPFFLTPFIATAFPIYFLEDLTINYDFSPSFELKV